MIQEQTSQQAIYEICLQDDRLQCTCDAGMREESFFQASGHYHQCMLYQVTRAIKLSLVLKEQINLGENRMKEYPCYYNRCPMNQKSTTVSTEQICTATVEIWRRCLRHISWGQTSEGKNLKKLLDDTKPNKES